MKRCENCQTERRWVCQHTVCAKHPFRDELGTRSQEISFSKLKLGTGQANLNQSLDLPATLFNLNLNFYLWFVLIVSSLLFPITQFLGWRTTIQKNVESRQSVEIGAQYFWKRFIKKTYWKHKLEFTCFADSTLADNHNPKRSLLSQSKFCERRRFWGCCYHYQLSDA